MKSQKKTISYPCQWSYKIIGENKIKMVEAINSVIQCEPFTLHESRASKNGKYISLEIEVKVKNEVERNTYFKLLAEHRDIRFVL